MNSWTIIQKDQQRRSLINQLTELKVSEAIETKQAHSWQYIDLKGMFNGEHEKHGVRELKRQLKFINTMRSRNTNSAK